MRNPYTEIQHYRMYFKESLRGLSTGAPVDLHGIHVGEVAALALNTTRTRHLPLPVDPSISIQKCCGALYRRCNARGRYDQASQREILDRLVAAGMRARLKSGNLVTASCTSIWISCRMLRARPSTGNTPRPQMPSIDGD